MWRVKTLNLGLSPSPQPVRRERPRRGQVPGWGAVGAEAGELWSHRSRAAGRFVGPAARLLRENTSRREEGRACLSQVSSHSLSLSGKTSYENSSPRAKTAARRPHRFREKTADVLLVDPISAQAGAEGEIRLGSFSTGLFAQAECSEEQRARAGT